MRVLVAEDNQVNQLFMRTLLRKSGHTVDIAETGAEALKAVQQTNYDVVLMDVQMPEMDGLTATRRIRSLPAPHSDIPIIALTANAMSQHRLECLEAGMNDFVSKPVDRVKLHGVLTAVSVGRVTSSTAPANKIAHELKVAGAHEQKTSDPKIVPIFDEERLAELRDSIPRESLGDMLAQIPDEGLKSIAQIKQAIATGDLEAARRAAHALAGVAGNFAAAKLERFAREIEADARAENTIDALVPDLENALRQTEEYLSTFK